MAATAWLWKDLGIIGGQGELFRLFQTVNSLELLRNYWDVNSDLMIFICRKTLQRSGKDHTVLLVLPSGVYRYKFIVDGEVRYIPDIPFVADEIGGVCNLLDVNVSKYSSLISFFSQLRPTPTQKKETLVEEHERKYLMVANFCLMT